MLSVEEEALCVAFRKHTLLPLDACLYALQATIPHPTRSSLHRLFRRHDISRLRDTASGGTKRKKFKAYPIGYFHIDIAEVRSGEGRTRLCPERHRSPADQGQPSWTNGQVERMNRTLKEATVRRDYYERASTGSPWRQNSGTMDDRTVCIEEYGAKPPPALAAAWLFTPRSGQAVPD